jgi:DNA-binding NarL/FixJ family response regulator
MHTQLQMPANGQCAKVDGGIRSFPESPFAISESFQVLTYPTNDLEALTPRESVVMSLICEGYSTKDIAAQLNITFKTAACHRSRILGKFRVHNSVALVRCAIRNGLIQP